MRSHAAPELFMRNIDHKRMVSKEDNPFTSKVYQYIFIFARECSQDKSTNASHFETVLLRLQPRDRMQDHCHIGTPSRDGMDGHQCAHFLLPKGLLRHHDAKSFLALGLACGRTPLLPALRTSSANCSLPPLVGFIVSVNIIRKI